VNIKIQKYITGQFRIYSAECLHPVLFTSALIFHEEKITHTHNLSALSRWLSQTASSTVCDCRWQKIRCL